MNRLRVQLVLAFTLVVLVAVAAIAVLILRTTDTQFRRYITRSGMQGSGNGLQQLIDYYDQEGGWEGVETLMQQTRFVARPSAASLSEPDLRPVRPDAELDVILANPSGRVVYDSTGMGEGRKLRASEMTQALSIRQAGDGEVIGYLLLSLPGDWERLGNLEQQFLGRMQQILLVGAAVAVGVGLAIGAILSRSLTAPLQRLAVAARAVATGDLNQRVKGEGSAEMVEVAQAFNEMTKALYESEEQRRNLVADAAHELRTPLTVLQGNLRAILDDVYPLDKDEISHLYDETRLLSRLVDDLRELALADAGQLRLKLRPENIAGIIQHTVASFGPAAESRGVALTSHCPENLSAVLVDTDRVAQILRNLLLNALRHTPSGGLVTVSARQTEGAVQVSVTDSGEGIDPNDLPHVFDRFWRADPARTRTGDEMQRGGTGLGLSVAQSLVEAMRGRIWAESSPGQGSTFWFSLPLATG